MCNKSYHLAVRPRMPKGYTSLPRHCCTRGRRHLYSGATMGKFIDLTGQKFTRLTAVKRVGTHIGMTMWLFKCDCGNEIIRQGAFIRNGTYKSCGCWKRDTRHLHKPHFKHGFFANPLGDIWYALIYRCENPNCNSYKHYGGRGIKVCGKIKSGPQSIIDIIGNRPTGLTIDRINNNGHYSCGACPECKLNKWICNIRWATRKTQGGNTRQVVLITYKGITKHMADWSTERGIPHSTLQSRLSNGYSVKRALDPSPITYSEHKNKPHAIRHIKRN